MTDTTTPSNAPAARTESLSKTYGSGDAIVRALDDVTVEFARGHFAAVMGPSGSGKSTLMHCMAGLDTPTSGRAFIGEEEIGELETVRSPGCAGSRRLRVSVLQSDPDPHRP